MVSKIILATFLIAFCLTQDAPQPTSDFENCQEDFNPSADGGKLGCKTCLPTFFSAVQNTGKTPELSQCVKCKDNCDKCKPDAADPKLPGDCEQCAEGFAPDAADKTTCKACEDSNCAQCTEDPAKCTTCKAKFALESDKCVACATGCDVCSNAATCTQCTPGPTFLSTTEGKCKDCKANCASCTNESDCQTCASGYFLKGTECTADCGIGYAGVSGVCEKCSTSCTVCTSSSKCTTCQEGFFASSTTGACQSCPAGCAVCANDGSCESCTTGTVQSDGTCSETPWYKQWWAWLLIGLGVLALLGGIAYLLSQSKTPARQYGSYQQYDTSYVPNQSYAPRASYELSQQGRLSQASQLQAGLQGSQYVVGPAPGQGPVVL